MSENRVVTRGGRREGKPTTGPARLSPSTRNGPSSLQLGVRRTNRTGARRRMPTRSPGQRRTKWTAGTRLGMKGRMTANKKRRSRLFHQRRRSPRHQRRGSLLRRPRRRTQHRQDHGRPSRSAKTPRRLRNLQDLLSGRRGGIDRAGQIPEPSFNNPRRRPRTRPTNRSSRPTG